MLRKTLLPLGSAALIGALLLPTIVGASPLSPGQSGSTASGIPAGAVMVPMTAAVATMVTNLGNGTSDVTYSNGQTISVATNVASQIYVGSGASATPYGVVTGNCGYSWLDLAKNSANGVTGSTGYEVNSRVGVPEAFEWAVHTDILQAPIGQYNHWDGATTLVYWFHGYTFDQGHATYASDVFDGYVIGTLTTCFSGNPSDIINT